MSADHLPASAQTALLDGDYRHPQLTGISAELAQCPQWTKFGYRLLENFPVTNEQEACRALYTLSRALGTVLGQDGAGQTVRKVRYRGMTVGQGATGRYSDSREGGQFHTDGPHRPGQPPEIFTLLCVRQARVGGALVLVDADDVVAALDAATIQTLQGYFLFDQREPGTVPVSRRVLRRNTGSGQWTFSYLRQYIELGHRYPHAWALTEPQRRALDRLDEVLDRLAGAASGHQLVKLRPGQLIIVDNRRVLHGRTSFEDDFPDSGRLMLRTWVSVCTNSPAA